MPNEDPRLAATREKALHAAQGILQESGIPAVTHASVSSATGISRSTLYRHWPDLQSLRTEAFRITATPPSIPSKTEGPLRADLNWYLSLLVDVLNETAWGQIVPQMVAAAATDEETSRIMKEVVEDRMYHVGTAFEAARDRGEIPGHAPIKDLVEIAVSVPYFRTLVVKRPLDADWLATHVEMVCTLAEQSPAKTS